MVNRKKLLEIVKVFIGSIMNNIPVQQQIIQKLSEILGIQRIVVFKLLEQKGGGGYKEYEIEISAGLPIEEHGIGLKEPISKHPDIKEAIEKNGLLITDPQNSPLTQYFREIIIRKNIQQILYIPLLSSISNQRIGLIVIDATGNKILTEDEIEFCKEVGEVISLIIEREEILIEQMRDLIVNKTVIIGGFVNRLKKVTEEFIKDTEIILNEVKNLEKSLCKKNLFFN